MLDQIVRTGIGLAYAESAWAAYKLRRKENIQGDIAELRKLLRRVPWWARGHALLGLSEVELASKGQPSARELSAIRVSAEAVLFLTGKAGKSRMHVVGRYLLAMVPFLARDYAEALNRFRWVLAYNNLVLLPKTLSRSALSCAAQAALQAGDESAACEYLLQIPAAEQSDEQREILRRLAARV